MEHWNNINININKYNKNNTLTRFYIVPSAWNILEQMEHFFGTLPHRKNWASLLLKIKNR